MLYYNKISFVKRIIRYSTKREKNYEISQCGKCMTRKETKEDNLKNFRKNEFSRIINFSIINLKLKSNY